MISLNKSPSNKSGDAKLKKCPKCKTYTFQDACKKCNSSTEISNHKFAKLRDAPPRSVPFKRR